LQMKGMASMRSIMIKGVRRAMRSGGRSALMIAETWRWGRGVGRESEK